MRHLDPELPRSLLACLKVTSQNDSTAIWLIYLWSEELSGPLDSGFSSVAEGAGLHSVPGRKGGWTLRGIVRSPFAFPWQPKPLGRTRGTSPGRWQKGTRGVKRRDFVSGGLRRVAQPVRFRDLGRGPVPCALPEEALAANGGPAALGPPAQRQAARAAGEDGAPEAGRPSVGGARGGGAARGPRGRRLLLGLLVLAAALPAGRGSRPTQEAGQARVAGQGGPGARPVGPSEPAEAAADAGDVEAALPAAARGEAGAAGGDSAAGAGPHAGRPLGRGRRCRATRGRRRGAGSCVGPPAGSEDRDAPPAPLPPERWFVSFNKGKK
nr:PREDICTED: collagen alpha-1(III) chain-like isoform X1 [Rhinolophus sinicus]XP_019586411.1 PREDICTED: collagen alpha-1(III) chain-like isoform X1 [Rhinolophus sinicus]